MDTKERLKILAARAISFPFRRPPPLLCCAGMVRNEMGLVEVWLDYIRTIFDRVVIYDHLSTDGTREFLLDKARTDPGLEVRLYDLPERAQSALMTEALQDFRRESDKGWAFFLDVDEFFIGLDRDAIRAFLGSVTLAPMVKMHWVNGYPADEVAQIGPDTPIKGWRTPSSFRKSAVNLGYVDTGTVVENGNHSLAFSRGRTRLYKAIMLGDLLHLPVRSLEQARQKVETGLGAHEATDTPTYVGTHWKEMQAELAKGFHAGVRSLAWRYSELNKPPVQPEDLQGALSDFVKF